MTTYFAWCKDKEAFAPQTHGRCDLEILELVIDHREGEVALATIKVVNPKLPSLAQRHAFISYEKTLLFSGRLVGLPVQITDDVVSLELTAEPLDADAQLENLGMTLKHPPFWDPAFVEPLRRNDPVEWLEARSALFCWNRVTGKATVSDLFQGRDVLDVTDVFYADSLKMTLAETPLSHLFVTLSVEWVQQAEGEVSVGGKIASAFPGGMINTLTPHALQETWPREGQKLGRSGFWVVKSHLQQVTPPRTGILDIYPTFTPEVRAWDETTQAPKAMRAKRFWMSGELVLGWRYRQKRREVVQFTLAQKTQLDGRIRPLSRRLNLSLQQTVPERDGTFFLTHRGRQAVEHALEIGRAHLAASARCLEVEVSLPWEAGFALSMDHSIHLADPRIPGGKVTGKVVAYQLYQDGIKADAWVRLAASVGGEPEQLTHPEALLYVEEGYGDTKQPMSYQTPSGMVYADYAHQGPTGGIVETKDLGLRDILKDVLVSQDAEQQVRTLQSQQYPVRQDMKKVLEDAPTQVSLDLLDLKTHAVAEHVIHLHIMGAWVAPQQVNLWGGW